MPISQRRGRRHPLASIALLLVGLFATGGAYALFTGAATAADNVASEAQVANGKALFAANCASCHGLNAEGTKAGPSLLGVGALAVEFQVGSGRMPMAGSGPQAEVKPVQFSQSDIDAMAAWVASLAPGPGIPDSKYLSGGDPSNGAELFRINCAMCHNVAGAGGALTAGKFAPNLHDVEPLHIYAAMVTGPQNMPVFSDMNISPEEKRDIIAYLQYMDENGSVGGLDLGALGPVSEGLFVWIFALGGLVAITIWLTAKSN
ncbi:MAG: menaquinol-cytochrome c reductase, cytochrome subunit [Actinomycetota bacterium]|jgi:ubiquinol-cytochrome c reductase cytochrome c subunit